jgi:predicted  nucleic acid-binding Zn-ribbon protein
MNDQDREIVGKIVAQKQYCAAAQVPNFAPHDGICFSCHRQIYENMSLERAGSDHITGCPRCNRSYCD